MSRVGVVCYRQEVEKKSCIPFLVELGREISVIGMVELIGSTVGTHHNSRCAVLKLCTCLVKCSLSFLHIRIFLTGLYVVDIYVRDCPSCQ